MISTTSPVRLIDELTDQGVFESILVRRRQDHPAGRAPGPPGPVVPGTVRTGLARRSRRTHRRRSQPAAAGPPARRPAAGPSGAGSPADHHRLPAARAPPGDVVAAPDAEGRAQLAAQVGRPRQPRGAEREAGASLPYFTPPARPELITETSRGNLFLLQADGVWCTPPLDEQVLPGVTRREVIDILDQLHARDARQAAVRIRPCSVEELRHAHGAFWTSSLSGAVGGDRRRRAPAAGCLGVPVHDQQPARNHLTLGAATGVRVRFARRGCQKRRFAAEVVRFAPAGLERGRPACRRP